jgi:hypothetical protein
VTITANSGTPEVPPTALVRDRIRARRGLLLQIPSEDAGLGPEKLVTSFVVDNAGDAYHVTHPEYSDCWPKIGRKVSIPISVVDVSVHPAFLPSHVDAKIPLRSGIPNHERC